MDSAITTRSRPIHVQKELFSSGWRGLRRRLKEHPFFHRIGRTTRVALLHHIESRSLFFPLLVDTRRSWDEYYGSLSKASRKNLKTSRKKFAHIRQAFRPFSPVLFETFWSLRKRDYPLTPSYRDRILNAERKGYLFTHIAEAKGTPITLTILERYGPYVYCHGPWYDKRREFSYLPTYIWFSIIQSFCGDPTVFWLDLGYGPLRRYPKDHYKRRYGPTDQTFVGLVCPTCEFRFVIPESTFSRPSHTCLHCATTIRAHTWDRILVTLYLAL